MKPTLLVMLVLVLVVLAGAGAAPISAASAVTCTASPSSGIAGTDFHIVCTGFAPNELVNTYMVEPDGRTIAGGEPSSGDLGWDIVPNTPRTDASGTVAFTFSTASVVASAQIGTWTIVADEPHGVSGAVIVTVKSNPFSVSGGTISVNPAAGRSFTFVGTGWTPSEFVDVWLTMPPNCSGTSGLGNAQFNPADGDRPGLGAVDPHSINTSYGWEDPGPHPKANEAGQWTYSIQFLDYACLGGYKLTARALGSGIGAQVEFEVTGNGVVSTGGASIAVILGSQASAIYPWVTVSGSGFPPGAGVTCWGTRPDGRAIPFANPKADAGGNFSVSGWAEDVDAEGENTFLAPSQPISLNSEAFSESAEPGEWSMTCATPDRSALAKTTFTLVSLTIDP